MRGVASDSKRWHQYACKRFGLDALSSHAASQSPSTIKGVPAVGEGGIITTMNVGWVSAMGEIFSFSQETSSKLPALGFLFVSTLRILPMERMGEFWREKNTT